MTGGRGGADRGLSSTTGMIIFIAIGAVLTASGTYLMLELGNEDIGRAATAAFDASQTGETVVIEHTTGDSIASENLRVIGATVSSMPAVVGSGSSIEVIPTNTTIELRYEDGRVSQELLTEEVEVTRLTVTVEDGNGTPLANHPVGVYDLSAKPTVSSPEDLLSAAERDAIPTPTFVGATDSDGRFVTVPATREGLETGGEYVLLTATTGPSADRRYAAGSVRIDQRENTVRLVLSD